MGNAKRMRASVAKRSRACGWAGLEGLESRVLLTAIPKTVLSGVISFPGKENGGGGKYPNSLVADSAGDLFGTTSLGGINNYGTIFEVPAGTQSVVTLATFTSGDEGFGPAGKLVLEGTTLYGATTNGGVHNLGTLYSFDTTTHVITTLYAFTGGVNGAHPTNGIASDGLGDFFGTTFGSLNQNNNANQNSATIFEYTLGTGGYQTLVSLARNIHIDTGVALDPATGLVALTDGAHLPPVVYASTTQGGANGFGSLISYTLGSGATTATTLASFNQSNGAGPIGTLYYAQDVDAAGDSGLVGLTSGGGAAGIGTIYDFPLVTGGGSPIASAKITLLGSFHGPNGSRPNGTLILADASNLPTDDLLGNSLYGTSGSGGNNGYGAVFKLPDAGVIPTGSTKVPTYIPQFTNMAFNYTTGIHPSAGLVLMPDGTLIGTLSARAKYTNGSLFELAANQPPLNPNHLVFSAPPGNAVAGVALNSTMANPAGGVVVKIVNSSGSVVTDDDSDVTLQVATGTGTFTPVTVAAVNGVATFTHLVLTKTGTYNLLATEGTARTQSNNFTVAAAAAAAIAIASQPNTGTTNSKLGLLVVNIDDAFGNVVTTDSSRVTLAVATGAGALTGTTTVSAKKGVATFNSLTLAAAGTYTLKATDAAFSATTAPIAVGLPATQMVFTGLPSTVSASFTIHVTLLDANGNVATTDGSLVKIALGTHPSGAKLFGTLSATAVAGVATFNLSIFKLGAYTLKATDGKLSVTSSLFDVVATA